LSKKKNGGEDPQEKGTLPQKKKNKKEPTRSRRDIITKATSNWVKGTRRGENRNPFREDIGQKESPANEKKNLRSSETGRSRGKEKEGKKRQGREFRCENKSGVIKQAATGTKADTGRKDQLEAPKAAYGLLNLANCTNGQKRFSKRLKWKLGL